MTIVGRYGDSSDRLRQRALALKRDRCSEDQVRWSLQKIHGDVENVLYDPRADHGRTGVAQLRGQLDRYKRMYPGVSEAFFLDNLLSMGARDLELVEKDVQADYPGKFLSDGFTAGETGGGGGVTGGRDTAGAGGVAQELGGTGTGGGGSRDQTTGSKKLLLQKSSEIRQRMAEVSLNCVITFSAMGFKFVR